MERATHHAEPRPSAFASQIGRTLRALRIERGWSQRVLAGRLALSPTQVSRYEAGLREVPLQTLMRAARVFRVSLDTFAEKDNFQYSLLLDDTLFECFRWVARLHDAEKKTALRLLSPEVLRQPQLVERFLDVAKASPETREAAIGALDLILASGRLGRLNLHRENP